MHRLARSHVTGELTYVSADSLPAKIYAPTLTNLFPRNGRFRGQLVHVYVCARARIHTHTVTQDARQLQLDFFSLHCNESRLVNARI